jgi:hypothetical protein
MSAQSARRRSSAGPYTAPASFAAPAPLALTIDQQYQAALAAGIAIVSTATPALAGTYAISDAQQSKITGITAGINSGKGLPGGGTTFNYPDAAGAMHPFGAADFLNFAKAIEDYVYALIHAEAALLGGHAGTWPAQPVTIA